MELAKFLKLLNATRKRNFLAVLKYLTEYTEWAIDWQVKNNTVKLKMV